MTRRRPLQSRCRPLQSPRAAAWPALLAGLLVAACASSPEPPPQPRVDSLTDYGVGEPGGVFVETTEVSARVVAIDSERRTVTLLGPDGEEFPVRVGPEAVNFDQIEVGDVVTTSITQELIVGLDDPAVPLEDVVVGEVARAPVGAKPGGVVTGTTRVTGTVTAIDLEAHTATLRFADGSSRTLAVRPDVDLALRKVGERVVFVVTESIAIDVRRD